MERCSRSMKTPIEAGSNCAREMLKLDAGLPLLSLSRERWGSSPPALGTRQGALRVRRRLSTPPARRQRPAMQSMHVLALVIHHARVLLLA